MVPKRTALIYAIFVLTGLLATVAIVSAFIAPGSNPPTATPTETISASRIGGTLGVGNGGTGASTLSGVLLGNGTGAITGVAGVTTDNVLKWNGTSWISSAVPAITGGGTANYLSKFTGSGVVGNSQIFDNGAGVGIGTGVITGGQKFQVIGGPVGIFNAASDRGLTINPGLTAGVTDIYTDFLGGTEPKLHLATYTNRAGAGGITIDTAGNIGVGTTSPGTNLEVAGQVKITGGTPATNRVLTSDASGLGRWADPAPGGKNSQNLANATTSTGAVFSVTVPANALSTNNMIQVTGILLTSNALTGNYRDDSLSLSYGGVGVCSMNVRLPASSNGTGHFIINLIENGATNAQYTAGNAIIGEGAGGSGNPLFDGSSICQTSTVVDSTVAQTLSMSVSALASSTFTVQGVSANLLAR